MAKMKNTGGKSSEQQRSPSTLESKMLAKLEQAETDGYQKYEQAESKALPYLLSTLRDWNSTIPLLPSQFRIGGYFINWNGFGLVIDPGYHFLQNFFEAGLHIRDIDSVLVTHNHADHNQDLRPIDRLLYEMNKRDKNDGYRYSLLLDVDSESKVAFKPPESQHRNKLKFDFDGGDQRAGQAIRIKQPKEAPFEVRYFKAKHSPDVPNAVGVRISFLDKEDKPKFVMGVSGDTAYFDGLCEDERLGHCDLLVAHIGQPGSDELVDETADLMKYNLGYRGTAKLIQGANPKLTVIGEFWPELADMRIDLVNGLRALCGTDAIFPSSRSFRVDPRNLTIQCTGCGCFAHHSEILVESAQTPFGPLSYVCKGCRAV